MLPTYKINIDPMDEETGCFTISMVEFPAVEIDFLKFDKEEPIKLHLNSDKHIVTGVALRADYPIYRNNSRIGEHYVVFTKQIIQQIIEKYSKYGFNNLVNIEHDENRYVDNVIMLESYIIDKERGLCPTEFSNIEDGSWIVSFKVNDVNLWDKIQSGEVKGFSIEGMFRYESVETQLSKTNDSTISIETNDLDDFIQNLLED